MHHPIPTHSTSRRCGWRTAVNVCWWLHDGSRAVFPATTPSVRALSPLSPSHPSIPKLHDHKPSLTTNHQPPRTTTSTQRPHPPVHHYLAPRHSSPAFLVPNPPYLPPPQPNGIPARQQHKPLAPHADVGSPYPQYPSTYIARSPTIPATDASLPSPSPTPASQPRHRLPLLHAHHLAPHTPGSGYMWSLWRGGRRSADKTMQPPPPRTPVSAMRSGLLRSRGLARLAG